MKSEKETIDSRIFLRVLSGLLAIGGLLAVAWRVYLSLTSTLPIDWGVGFGLLGAVYGIYLFGYFMIKGNVTLKMDDPTDA